MPCGVAECADFRTLCPLPPKSPKPHEDGITMNLKSLSLLAFTACILLGGCQTGPSFPKNSVLVSASQNQSQVTLRPGQMLILQLERNPTTGYIWQLTQQINQAVLMSDGTKDFQTASERASGSNLEMQYLRFVAQSRGEVQINLNYIQADVGPRPDSAHFILDVIVE